MTAPCTRLGAGGAARRDRPGRGPRLRGPPRAGSPSRDRSPSDRARLPRLGAAAGVGRHRSRRAAVRMGPRLARPAASAPVADPAAWLEDWARRAVGRQRRFYDAAAVRRLRARRRSADVHERDHDAASREQHRPRALLPRDRSPRGRRRAVLVLPQWNSDAEGHVGLCRLLNRFGISRAAAELAVSRRAHAARAPARRLHRQRERRPDRAGLPAGGARRAAGDRVARARRATSRSASSARASARACRC